MHNAANFVGSFLFQDSERFLVCVPAMKHNREFQFSREPYLLSECVILVGPVWRPLHEVESDFTDYQDFFSRQGHVSQVGVSVVCKWLGNIHRMYSDTGEKIGEHVSKLNSPFCGLQSGSCRNHCLDANGSSPFKNLADFGIMVRIEVYMGIYEHLFSIRKV